jgi:predicted alpha/beta-fold hydrolase
VADSTDNKFSPAWWLPGSHLQTLWSQFFRRGRVRDARVERIPTPDDDQLLLHHVDAAPDRPRLLLLHGLEGSIHSHYVAGFVALARRRQWNATVLEFRGCGQELNRAPRLYHSGETTDLDLVVRLLTERSPGVPLCLAGVSLGGNVLLKWLGERGSKVPGPVKVAGTVSVPFDLEAGCRHLQIGFNRIYDRHFLTSLRLKALRKLDQWPGLFDRVQLLAARTIEDFDNAVTGPVHGFAGSHDYYEKSSSIHALGKIRVPTLLLNARDDPFLPPEVLHRAREAGRSNPFLQFQFTETGGHVGFVSGGTPFRARYWAEERLMAFFDSELDSGALAARGVAV